MGPGGELRLGIGVIVISGIKQNFTVTIMNNKRVQRLTQPLTDLTNLNQLLNLRNQTMVTDRRPDGRTEEVTSALLELLSHLKTVKFGNLNKGLKNNFSSI